MRPSNPVEGETYTSDSGRRFIFQSGAWRTNWDSYIPAQTLDSLDELKSPSTPIVKQSIDGVTQSVIAVEARVTNTENAQAAGRVVYANHAAMTADITQAIGTNTEIGASEVSAILRGVYTWDGAAWVVNDAAVEGRISYLESGEPTKELLENEFGLISGIFPAVTDTVTGRKVVPTHRNGAGDMVQGFHVDDGSPWPTQGGGVSARRGIDGRVSLSLELGSKRVPLVLRNGELASNERLNRSSVATQGGAQSKQNLKTLFELGVVKAPSVVAGGTFFPAASSLVNSSTAFNQGSGIDWAASSVTWDGGTVSGYKLNNSADGCLRLSVAQASDNVRVSLWLAVTTPALIQFSRSATRATMRQTSIADKRTVETADGHYVFLENIEAVNGVIELELRGGTGLEVAGVLVGEPLPDSRPEELYALSNEGSQYYHTGGSLFAFDDGDCLESHVDYEGYTVIAYFDESTKQVTSFRVPTTEQHKDDHNNGSFVRTPDGMILHAHALHLPSVAGVNEDKSYFIKSLVAKPTSSADWGPVLEIDHSGDSYFSRTYANLHVIGGEVYMIGRSRNAIVDGVIHSELWFYIKSSDSGTTWTAPAVWCDQRKYKGAGCYQKHRMDPVTGRLHVFVTTHRVSTALTQGLHFSFDGVNYYNTDGTIAKVLADGPLYLHELNQSSYVAEANENLLQSGQTLDDFTPESRMWDAAVALNSSGYPVIYWVGMHKDGGHLETMLAGGVSSRDETDRHVYYRSEYNPDFGGFTREAVAMGGYGINPNHPGYLGGLSVDPNNANFIVFSSNSSNPSRLDMSTPISDTKAFEIWGGIRSEDTDGWHLFPITTDSPIELSNTRPVTSISEDGSQLRATWMRGIYSSYGDVDGETTIYNLNDYIK